MADSFFDGPIADDRTGGDPAPPRGPRGQDPRGWRPSRTATCAPSPSSTTCASARRGSGRSTPATPTSRCCATCCRCWTTSTGPCWRPAREPAAAVTTGVELIQRELLRVLEKFGLTPFSSVGQPFDPDAARGGGAGAAPGPARDDGRRTRPARGYLLQRPGAAARDGHGGDGPRRRTTPADS